MDDTQMPQQVQDKLVKFQGLQNQLQMIAMQRQQLSMQSKDIENALNELKEQKGKVYRLSGPIMVEADKEITEKELSAEKEKLESNLLIYEKHEKKLSDQLKNLSTELQTMMGARNTFAG